MLDTERCDSVFNDTASRKSRLRSEGDLPRLDGSLSDSLSDHLSVLLETSDGGAEVAKQVIRFTLILLPISLVLAIFYLKLSRREEPPK